ncbi:MAG: response regulator [Nitrospirae bacterium]|nr:response regulator [Nitrospirota bacterium]
MAEKKILIIESSETFSDYIVEMLKRVGFKTLVAADGDEGIDAARKENFNLILLSVELPKENGYLICKKFKEDNELKKIPLILMSSEAKKNDFEQHKKLKVRADDYLKKPFAKRELIASIANLIGCEIPIEIYCMLEERVEALIKEKDILEKDSKNKEKLIFELRERLNKTSGSSNIDVEKLQKELIETRREMEEAKKEIMLLTQKNEAFSEKIDEINKEKKELIKSSIADFADRDKREADLKKRISYIEKDIHEQKHQIKKALENAISSLKE